MDNSLVYPKVDVAYVMDNSTSINISWTQSSRYVQFKVDITFQLNNSTLYHIGSAYPIYRGVVIPDQDETTISIKYCTCIPSWWYTKQACS